jgi:hypothetical protein
MSKFLLVPEAVYRGTHCSACRRRRLALAAGHVYSDLHSHTRDTGSWPQRRGASSRSPPQVCLHLRDHPRGPGACALSMTLIRIDEDGEADPSQARPHLPQDEYSDDEGEAFAEGGNSARGCTKRSPRREAAFQPGSRPGAELALYIEKVVK